MAEAEVTISDVMKACAQNVPVPRDIGFWIDVDGFLSRFWIVPLAVIALATWIVLAYLPTPEARASTSITNADGKGVT